MAAGAERVLEQCRFNWLSNDIVKSNKGRLSEYAKENSRDFFAECFANLNCGKPNEYGIALSEFLKQRGLL